MPVVTGYIYQGIRCCTFLLLCQKKYFLLLQLEFSVFCQETPPIFRQPFGVYYWCQKIKFYQTSSQHPVYMHHCLFFIRCYLVSFPHYPSSHKKSESTLFSHSLLNIRITVSSQNWALRPLCIFSPENASWKLSVLKLPVQKYNLRFLCKCSAICVLILQLCSIFP